MDLSYERLTTIYRLEKESGSLTRLEPDFYGKLEEFIQEEKKRMLETFQNMDFSAYRRYESLRGLVQEIIAIRTRKVLTYAYDLDSEPENLVGWERELFDNVRELVLKYSNRFDSILGRLVPTEDSEKTLSHVRVRILKNIPAFIGTDRKEYGPYSEGEEVELPKELADILVLRKLAEAV